MSEPRESDVDVLAEILEAHGLGWVIEQLGDSDVEVYIHEHSGWNYTIGLEEAFETLEDSHYPQPLIELLVDNQHTPWLTPNLPQG